MRLNELTINGFKSFAKKGELEFAAPITAIVGPNGSGKSNVAEAFRFVLGEQSVKAMRGKRGEDLIWGGSQSVSRANRASVSVTLDNADRTFALDFDEVRLERTVHRDGQNEYLLNGSTVRLKDILELLAAANIGATGHHIISQGEADRILSANARERREMIEDALGLKSYQYKKQEAERKLEKTLENMRQVDLLRKEAAPHLKFLERQVKKLERSKELRTEINERYAEYLRREDTYLAHQVDALTARRREPEAALASANKALTAAKEALAALERSDASDELMAAQEAWRTSTNERQELQREHSKLEGQVALLERRVAVHTNQAAEQTPTQVPADSLTPILLENEAKATELAQADAATIHTAFTELLGRLRACLEAARSEPVADVSADETEIKALATELHTITEALDEASAKEARTQAAYEALQIQRETEATEGREAEREVFRLTSEVRQRESELERIDTELAALERDRVEFKRELQEAVALVGRQATRYFEYVVRDSEGSPVTSEVIAAEPRERQRARRAELERAKIRLEELGIGASDDIEQEYANAKERDDFLANELADLAASVEKLRELIGELEAKLGEEFDTGIQKISAEFSRFFMLMFGGGSAALETVIERPKRASGDDQDSLEHDETEAAPRRGVELAVALPNKRVKGLEMLSGGERALTSIALIFAMSQVNPPPFLILDETDAALDEANSRRYGDMIEALAERSQLILITHNRETMSRAGVLYGVTMGADGVSKLLSVKFDDALAHAK